MRISSGKNGPGLPEKDWIRKIIEELRADEKPGNLLGFDNTYAKFLYYAVVYMPVQAISLRTKGNTTPVCLQRIYRVGILDINAFLAYMLWFLELCGPLGTYFAALPRHTEPKGVEARVTDGSRRRTRFDALLDLLVDHVSSL